MALLLNLRASIGLEAGCESVLLSGLHRKADAGWKCRAEGSGPAPAPDRRGRPRAQAHGPAQRLRPSATGDHRHETTPVNLRSTSVIFQFTLLQLEPLEEAGCSHLKGRKG